MTKLDYLILTLALSTLLASCAAKEEDAGSVGRKTVPEESNCTASTVSNPVVVSGTARYTGWDVTTTGLTSTSTKNIRYAEVRVKNSTGTVVQCGETDANGAFSLSVAKPSSTSVFTVEVNSRSYGNYVKASVLDNPYDNKVYTLSSNITVTASDTSISAGTLTAPHDGTLSGGAFNILDQIYKVNDYLRQHTGTCSAGAITCETFTVAPKVKVYWSPGFNPVAYYSSADAEEYQLSFMDVGGDIAGTPALYILGGLAGDFNNADTDHFDNSVIIHEYGHFLEYTYSNSDSQGGPHNGNLIIDPRLAWSEGFNNFLPGLVLGTGNYRDTKGNSDGSTSVIFNINLETPITGMDVIDSWTPTGEGNFRELVVARTLYDLVDANSDTHSVSLETDTANFDFSYLWEAYTDSTNGLKKSTLKFISAGDFYSSLNTILSTIFGSSSTEVTALTDVLAMESVRKDRTDWGAILSSSASSCGNRTISPKRNQTVPGSSEAFHNLFRSSDFFQYYHSGGPLSITLTYTRNAGSLRTDLDLVIYTDNFVVFDSDSVLEISAKAPASESPSGTESISVFNANAGYYMIHVLSDEQYTNTESAGASYYLKVGSNYLCQ